MNEMRATDDKGGSGTEIEELYVSRLPILLWVCLVYVAAILLQNLTEPTIVNSLFFTAGYCLHAMIYWNSYRITATRPWLYFVIQGIFITSGALLLPGGSPAILIGLFPILIGQSIGLYYQKRKIALVTLYCMVMFFYTVMYLGDRYDLILLVPLFVLMMIIVMAYAHLFFEQVYARKRTLTFLRDLESANRKVEELTLANERQRMARDLHDTLAQGVAGLIMQLEAANTFITQGNTGRSQEIIRQSMSQARRTLAEARLVIDDLRQKSGADMSLQDSLSEEIQRFIHATGIEVVQHIKVPVQLSRTLMEHSLSIVSECLTNVAKHAQASKVWVTVVERSHLLQMEIRDNGIGFQTEVIDQHVGHYGMLGIRERTRLIEGKLSIHSSRDGTRIFLEAPIHKGEES